MTDDLTPLQQSLLAKIQQDFPICSDPCGALAEEMDCSRDDVLNAMAALRSSGIIRRIGGSFVPKKMGYVSVLAAARVAPEQLEEAAARASAFDEVTHNYERQSAYNLWFTVIARDEQRLNEIIADIDSCEGVSAVHALPATQTFKLKVNFDVSKDSPNA
jgi:DNA-binding Lrp family transcriptional regulator